MTTVERGEGWYCGGGSYLLIGSVAVVFLYSLRFPTSRIFQGPVTYTHHPCVFFFFFLNFS